LHVRWVGVAIPKEIEVERHAKGAIRLYVPALYLMLPILARTRGKKQQGSTLLLSRRAESSSAL
jgi:hypothetical protein